jgi:nicotinamidase-related amidase
MTETLDAIDPLRSALLVMDYQSGILERLENTDELVERAERAIALARSRGATVGYVRVAFADADYENVPRTSRMWTRVAQAGRAFHADAPATAIHERLAPEPGDVVVRKVRVGAFSTTDLDAQLRERGLDTLILAGISTSGVVLSTVRDASDRDYRVLVLRDVSADPQPDVHEFLTTRVFPNQAEVLTIGELEDRLAPAAADS